MCFCHYRGNEVLRSLSHRPLNTMIYVLVLSRFSPLSHAWTLLDHCNHSVIIGCTNTHTMSFFSKCPHKLLCSNYIYLKCCCNCPTLRKCIVPVGTYCIYGHMTWEFNRSTALFCWNVLFLYGRQHQYNLKSQAAVWYTAASKIRRASLTLKPSRNGHSTGGVLKDWFMNVLLFNNPHFQLMTLFYI